MPSGHQHLTYHYVREGVEHRPACAPAQLEAQIVRLKAEGFQIWPLRQYAQQLANSKEQRPERVATLSFDDGLADHCRVVLPILQKHRVPATFFIIAESLERKLPWVIANQVVKWVYGPKRMMEEVLPDMLREYPQYLMLLKPEHAGIGELCLAQVPDMRVVQALTTRYIPSQLYGELLDAFLRREQPKLYQKLVDELLMTPEEVRLLGADELVTIGSHTMSHPYLTTLSTKQLEVEFRSSAALLRQLTGQAVDILAYPFGGSMPERVLETARSSGYQSAWNYRIPGMTSHGQSAFDIVRDDHGAFS